MAIQDNERLQETFILIGDQLAPVRRGWWYALAIALVLAVPGYYLMKSAFVNAFVGGYSGPAVVYTAVDKQPLQILEKKIFALPNNTYAGYVKVKNANLEWGVAEQRYTFAFKTFGGTTLSTATRSTFILPGSEKLIVLPSFSAAAAPNELDFTLDQTHFIHRPATAADFEVQRTTVTNAADGLVVASAFKNLTPFTITQVNVPVAVYNSANEIVAVNFTYLNDVKSAETRTFQFAWPGPVTGAVRAEINPEVDIFDPGIFAPDSDAPPSSSADRPQ